VGFFSPVNLWIPPQVEIFCLRIGHQPQLKPKQGKQSTKATKQKPIAMAVGQPDHGFLDNRAKQNFGTCRKIGYLIFGDKSTSIISW
jgi:hypothetical protein